MRRDIPQHKTVQRGLLLRRKGGQGTPGREGLLCLGDVWAQQVAESLLIRELQRALAGWALSYQWSADAREGFAWYSKQAGPN